MISMKDNSFKSSASLEISNCTQLEQIDMGKEAWTYKVGEVTEEATMTLESIVIGEWWAVDLPALYTLVFDYHAGDNFLSVKADGVGMKGEPIDPIKDDHAFSSLESYEAENNNNEQIDAYFTSKEQLITKQEY